MKAFSIVCIVLGVVCLFAFAFATEPPVSTLEETAGLGLLTAMFLIALGIVGVVTAKSPSTLPLRAYASYVMPVSNIPTPPRSSAYCVSCGVQRTAGAAFCTVCGKAM